MSNHDRLRPPPSSTFRSLVSSGFGLIIGVPLSIWVNLITAEDYTGIFNFVFSNKTWALLISGVLICINLFFVRKWDIQERDWNRITSIVKSQHALSVQQNILKTYCMLLTEILGCRVSARLIEAKFENGKYNLYHVRDVFVENEFFPQETAYTYVPEDHVDFIHNKAFRNRAPVYEILAADHSDHYPEREKRMVEPGQRWVLAAPIPTYDESGRSREELPPRGVVVFYGRTVPSSDALPSSDKGEHARAISRDAGETFVYMSLGATPSYI